MDLTWGDFRQRKRFDQKAYKLPPSTSAHVPTETNKRPLEQQPGPFSKKKRVFIALVITPPGAPVLIARPFKATPQPVSIPDPPELTTSQIPDQSPELTTSQILLPDPPVQTQPLRSFYQIHHLSRQYLRSFYQIHLWSRLWSLPLRMTLS
ncbi:hypothetical protein TNCV_174891 [Trichonephila clavipes]|nr:hypothetical protein TNCV_174891 [Trichonephila clavipes]